LHYQSRRSYQALCQEVQQLARAHPRFGYRRVGVLLRRAGQRVNHKRVWRVWQELNLSLPRRRPRARRTQKVQSLSSVKVANQVWCYDFVFDACANGQRLKVLTLQDEYTRECLALEVGTSMKSRQVIEVLERVVRERGVPAAIRSDHGSEFISNRVQEWLAVKGIEPIYTKPGSPWENGKNESFNGRLRDECLNLNWFHNVCEARVILQRWRTYYNQERPHSSLKYQTPSEFRLKNEAVKEQLKT
jgi:putative transposase